MREVAAGTAHLPDPFVREIPAILEEAEERSLELPRRTLVGEADALTEVESVHHLPINIEL
jgi:hypothetical protein